jgi:hypothetical protein
MVAKPVWLAGRLRYAVALKTIVVSVVLSFIPGALEGRRQRDYTPLYNVYCV